MVMSIIPPNGCPAFSGDTPKAQMKSASICRVLPIISTVLISCRLFLLEPESGGIRGTPRRGGASGSTRTRPVGGPLFDFYVGPLMLDSYICIL